ncbi:hypothetical protein PHYBLDRAFT_157963 [Phycomyces blakesleeanus NRRL 1555(-)]|uniref:Uncharacterized protein n=1 Tax=Phycomyces blakesleeanus (strain ATCC 8743b / DSM 1359 / FGSC 10004 / NBRC 33097 / NRRL 1555) TaxID=763407 RepID=A0A162UJB5_PHYB8|nr:hypothetical protein PHYBLDRAFT_157963 [Phycomyces blakesleeanus NRRL 1555(-)]OAD76622.1 hypothetical protein PHYBLDRAFT_157963 [Phycomyces blakesleeanus NRRL 1555(-)]|eukprot:XP_018294662.1 hypothetical protein PHYBLDRAFT_157963 [Phycomyces blakesleeanus NRRL 1555(-)]
MSDSKPMFLSVDDERKLTYDLMRSTDDASEPAVAKEVRHPHLQEIKETLYSLKESAKNTLAGHGDSTQEKVPQDGKTNPME